MTRIFSALACVSLILLAANFAVGWFGGDYNGVSGELKQADARLRQIRSQSNPDSAELEAADQSLQGVYRSLAEVQQRANIHMMLGLLATLVTVLVNSIAVTYFIGTGRWCKEVAETYEMSDELVAKSIRLKKKTFPFSMMGIGVVLAIAAFGAAADPGTLRDTTAGYVAPHFMLAMLGTLLIAWAMFKQFQGIRANNDLIGEFMAEVSRIRQERGLET